MKTISKLFFFLIFLSETSMAQNNLAGAFSLNSTQQLNYLVQLPGNYNPDSNTKYPLILFLHGSGERGIDINKVKAWGPPRIAEEKDLPFVVVSPQCSEGVWWDVYLYSLNGLVTHICHTYPIDTTRLYLTGLSMGGFGTWALAAAYPGRFAAIAPVCGGGNANNIEDLINTPTWAFHGSADPVVPEYSSRMMVDSLKANGGKVKYTVFEGVGHDSWIPAYNESGLFEWFLQHQLSKKDSENK